MNDKRYIYSVLGASNHSKEERADFDYYATEPKAIDVLINDGGVVFNKNILECACGAGHLSERLKEYGYNVTSRDLVNRGYGETGIDFLQTAEIWGGDIVTNPPYKHALEFINHSLEILQDGNKAFMFLRLQFLEGKARKALFDTGQLKTVYISRSRLSCAKNGDFDKSVNAVAYAWFEFQKGYKGDAVIKWIN